MAERNRNRDKESKRSGSRKSGSRRTDTTGGKRMDRPGPSSHEQKRANRETDERTQPERGTEM